jgi:cytochrome c
VPGLKPLAMAAVGLALAACHAQATVRAGDGDPARGQRLVNLVGCGSCHQIPGVAGADGMVGPPLIHMGRRTMIAGMLPNTPANMMVWLEHPQRIVPGNAMPDTGLGDGDARDITAYLASLR